MAETLRNVVFPEYISYLSQSGESWSTQVVRTAAGFEIRNSYYSNPLRTFTTNIDDVRDSDMAEVKDFFQSMRGRLYSFRFRDWTDYLWRQDGETDAVTFETYRGPGNYQLTKTYATGVYFYKKPIKLPRVQGQNPAPGVSYDSNHPAQNFELYIDDTLLTKDIDYTVSTTTGIINIPSAITGTNLRAKYEYDVACRFDTDIMDVSKTDSVTQTWSSFRIQEVRY